MDKLYDVREFPFFQLDNDLIDKYFNLLDVYEFRIYVTLTRYANSGRVAAFPSYQTLSEKTLCSKRKAIDAVASLIKKGFIKKVARENTSNNYYIMPPDNITSALNAPLNIVDEQSAPLDNVGSALNALGGSALNAPNKEILSFIKDKTLSDNSDVENISDPIQLTFEPETPKQPKQPKKPKDPPNPHTKELIEYFKQKYIDKLGTQPIITYTADGAIIKSLLTKRTCEDLKKIIDFYFESEDNFLKSSGYSISKLTKCVIPKYDSVQKFGETVPKVVNYNNNNVPQTNNYERRKYSDIYYQSLLEGIAGEAARKMIDENPDLIYE